MDSQLTTLFKALSDETRMEIVRLILKKGEICNQTAAKYFTLSQPTLSHHFNILVSSQLLTERKDGTWRFYLLNKPFLEKVGLPIEKMLKNAK